MPSTNSDITLILGKIELMSNRQETLIDEVEKVKTSTEKLKTAVVGSEDGVIKGLNSKIDEHNGRLMALEKFNDSVFDFFKYVGAPVLAGCVGIIFWKIKSFFGIHQ